METRIGIGEDSHPFQMEEKKLILGGVVINEAPGLAGNSDGDVILHAICNAFDVVAQAGSLATYSDKMCNEGIADSSRYVDHIRTIAAEKGWRVVSASIAVEAKIPPLEPSGPLMRKSIAKILRISDTAVGVTFTSGEELSSCGRGEGIRASAILTLIKD